MRVDFIVGAVIVLVATAYRIERVLLDRRTQTVSYTMHLPEAPDIPPLYTN